MRLFQLLFLFVLSILLMHCSKAPEKEKISLQGEWKVRLDSLDVGIKNRWYRDNFSQSLKLPGSLQEQGYGNDIDSSTSWTGTVKGNFHQDPKYKEYRQEDDYKVPFWLNPEKHYKGAAWYQKKVNIPENWTEKHVKLILERPHWETTVFVNGEKTGVRNSLSAPHEYDLTDYLTPGENNLTIRVDNRLVINVGKNSHSVTDHTQSNWNGITGDIFLKAEPLVHIEDMQIYPDVQNDMATVEVRLNNETGKRYEGQMTFLAQTEQAMFGHKLEEIHRDIRVDSSRTVRVDYFMGDDPLLWSEFDPNLYSMQVRLRNTDNEQVDADSVIFGMREFTTKETRFVINHRPTYLRGTLECAIFPDTGYPPTDTESWGRIFRTIKKHGLNHMRFHSWCPPEAAFTAADKAGIYLQVEVASWANQGAELGSGLPVDQWIYEESNRIVEEYGNHPSFCMMAYGNEPAGENQQKYLTEFVEYWKNKDSRRLYTSASGWPLIEASQFHVAPQPRIQGWGEELNSVINREPPHTTFNHEDFVSEYDKPVIGHEIGQWCVYPNFDEMKKYTGVLKPKNFEIFRDMLKDNHMLDKAEKFHMASGKLQALCYKADIEAALRTPGFAGFQLLDLHDFPGQGTALVGVLDPFWESKPYISPQEYSRFCGPTVPLAKLSKRIYRNSETFEATIELAHFGSSLLINIPMNWKIEDSTGEILQKGELQKKGISYDNCQKIGDIRFDLKEIEKPQKLTLTATLSEFGSNSWDFWVYPDQLDMPDSEDVVVATELTSQVRQRLSQGRKVLLILHNKIKDDKGGNVKAGFSPIFWNTVWTDNQAPHTMGILCDPEHPLFNAFPTEYHSNWQWWDIVTGAQVMNMEDFPQQIDPLIQSIPDYHKNRKLAFAFEGKAGEGKILVTSIDFTKDLEENLASKQLYYSMLNYMESEDFSPEHTVSLNDIETLKE